LAGQALQLNRLISGCRDQKQALTGQREFDKLAGKCSIIFLKEAGWQMMNDE
jgi:hypothetical protein